VNPKGSDMVVRIAIAALLLGHSRPCAAESIQSATSAILGAVRSHDVQALARRLYSGGFTCGGEAMTEAKDYAAHLLNRDGCAFISLTDVKRYRRVCSGADLELSLAEVVAGEASTTLVVTPLWADGSRVELTWSDSSRSRTAVLNLKLVNERWAIYGGLCCGVGNLLEPRRQRP